MSTVKKILPEVDETIHDCSSFFTYNRNMRLF